MSIICVQKLVCDDYKMEEEAEFKCTNFHDNLKSTFKNLDELPDMSDVTLVCEDGQQQRVHKAVIAASSPLFHSLLSNSGRDHQTIFLAEIGSELVKSLVEFMYFGETKVRNRNMESFLAIAKALKMEALDDQLDVSPEEIHTKTVPVIKLSLIHI